MTSYLAMTNTLQLWPFSPGAAVTAERRVANLDANAASSSAAEEQDLQKHAEELVNNWIDRTLTPAIQKQVCARHCGLGQSVY